MTQDNNKTQSRKRKLFVTFSVLALMAGLAVFVTSAAFTATTDNPNNRIESGSVEITDSDAASGALYSALNQKPGAANGPAPRCIRVSYSGSLAASVKLYVGALSNGSKFRLKVERGSGLTSPDATMNCAGFASSSTPFDNTLGSFPTTYATGIDGKASGTAWNTGDTMDYRFTVYVIDDNTPNAHTVQEDSLNHTYTWEAQNN